MTKKLAHFRFYEELNDFLVVEKRKTTIQYEFNGAPSIKDVIEAIGVPHPAVDLILVNGLSIGFDYQLRAGDRVAVYPVFETLDISPIVRVRPQPLRDPRFILDVHLGKLARRLRLLGFDTLYQNDYHDSEIVQIALRERRIILTRDRGILKRKEVIHGYWLRANCPDEQISEVLHRFHLFALIKPFQRCLVCNGLIEGVEKSAVNLRLPTGVAREYDEFFECGSCGRVYWRGSHFDRLNAIVKKLANLAHHEDGKSE
ncbi:MAG TPA: Mut7-C RNAse domain-containing protein [bacterium]